MLKKIICPWIDIFDSSNLGGKIVPKMKYINSSYRSALTDKHFSFDDREHFELGVNLVKCYPHSKKKKKKVPFLLLDLHCNCYYYYIFVN